MAKRKAKESRPAGAPRLDRDGRDLDAAERAKKPREAPHPEKISREISAVWAVGEAARRTGEAHEILARIHGRVTPGEVLADIERARSLLIGTIRMLDINGDK